jgi:hypothetical protein
LSTVGLVGIVGGVGAAAAGVVAVAGKGGDEGSAASVSPTSYTGPFSGERTVTGVAAAPGCQSFTSALSGTLRITLEPSSGGTVTGTANTTGSSAIIRTTGNCVANAVGVNSGIGWTSPVTGTPASLVFSEQRPGADPGCCPESIEFSGALNGGVISGSLTFTQRGDGGRFGTTSIPVNLR